MKKILFFAAIVMTMVACSSDIQPPGQVDRGEEKVVKLLKQFRRSIKPNTRNEDLTIVDIQRKHYVFTNDSIMEVPSTRIIDPDSLPHEEILPNEFYISQVIFTTGTTLGYSYICDDERIDKVLFYTDCGSPSDTIYNVPLKKTVNMYPTVVASILRNGYQLYAFGETTISTTPNMVGNIMSLNWDQSYPYNMYAPPANWHNSTNQIFYKNRAAIGCVTVATAQLIAHCRHFRGSFYGNGSLNLSTLANRYYLNSQDSIKIGQFMHEIALNCNINFNDTLGSSSIVCASKYLIDQGYSCQYQTSLDLDRLMINIHHGYPQMVRGADSSKKGHAWLITGYHREIRWTDLFCNWGWGGSSNGWTISNPYTTGNGTTYGNQISYVYVDGYIN